MNEIIKKNGITYGVISGLVSILITTLIYTIDLKLFISMWVGLVSIVAYITIGCVLLIKTKKDLSGIMSFKQGFTTYFISAVIGILISVFFNILLFNYIDPAAKDTVKEYTIEYTVEMMEKFGTPASAINEAVKGMQDVEQFSTFELLKGSIFTIAFSAVFGLILAAIFKSKNNNQGF